MSSAKPRRYFLFMSSDGCFDHMHEDVPEKQNRIIAKGLGHFIEDGEKFGEAYWSREEDDALDALEKQATDAQVSLSTTERIVSAVTAPSSETVDSNADNNTIGDDTTAAAAAITTALPTANVEEVNDTTPMQTDTPPVVVDGVENAIVSPSPPRPLLVVPPLPREKIKQRRIKERTLSNAVRYFANREGDLSVFSSTLQDYDDCTIILAEI
jgi:hypothetical protein